MSVLITSIVLFVISALVLTFTAVYMDKKGFSGSKKYIERSKKGYKFIPLSLLSFVENPQNEISKIQKDNEQLMNGTFLLGDDFHE